MVEGDALTINGRTVTAIGTATAAEIAAAMRTGVDLASKLVVTGGFAAAPAAGWIGVPLVGGAGAVVTLTNTVNGDVTNFTASTGTPGGANLVEGGLGADVISLRGSDTVVIGNSDSSLSLTSADIIRSFNSVTDTLKVGVAGVVGGPAATYVVGADQAGFAAALVEANAVLATLAGASTATELFAFVYDTTAANGYLFNDIDGDGDADQVIVLVGVTSADINAGDLGP
jgi:hypothetical protein